MKFVLFLVLSFYIFPTFAQTPKSSVFRQGDYRVRQMVSPSFDYLPLNRKVFAYHLYNAAVASHEILWQQLTPSGMKIRDTMETMWNYSHLFSPTFKASLSEYIFLLYAETGNYEKNSNQKIVLTAKPEDFARAAELVAEQLPEEKATEFRASIQNLSRTILDPDYLRTWQAQDPLDKVAHSNTGYYGDGVSEQLLSQFPNELVRELSNYPTVDDKGRVQFIPQRIGARFSQELLAVDHHLAQALPYANESEKEIISAYRAYYRSGHKDDLRKAETLWVQYKPSDIDFMITFVETYDDPLKFRGAWEAFVLLIDITPDTVKRVDLTRANARYFETQMPVDEKYKKNGEFDAPKAEGAFLLFGEGRSTRRSWSGKNVPNDSEITDVYGSKSYTANNVMFDVGKATATTEDKETFPKKYHDSLKLFDPQIYRKIQVEFHEILGHGSGMLMPGVSDQDLKEMYSPIEEARAETASLYHLTDPAVAKLGILPNFTPEDFAIFSEMALSRFFADQISAYSKLKDNTTQIRQAHMWGRQLMLNYLLSKDAIEIITKENEAPTVLVKDLNLARKSLGEIWAQLQTIRSEGLYEAAKEFFVTYGQYEDRHKELRARVVAVQQKKNVAKELTLLSPGLRLITDKAGNPTQVKIVYHNKIRHLEDVIEVERNLTKKSKNMLDGFACANLFSK